MPENEQYSFIKWLRYYLDFCHKYGFEKTDPGNLHRFIKKLRSEKQNQSQQRQANYDICTIQELLGHSDVRTIMI